MLFRLISDIKDSIRTLKEVDLSLKMKSKYEIKLVLETRPLALLPPSGLLVKTT